MAAKGGKRKNRRPSSSVPVAVDSGPTSHPTSKPSEADDPGSKNSTSNPNPNIESHEWVSLYQEQRLDEFIRKKLSHLYGQALSRLVSMGYDEDVALQGLLERGYCVGVADSLTNVVQNSLDFITGEEDVESEQDRPEPFQNLELLLEFNLQFLVYVLKYVSPNLNRISLLRRILMNDLNLNRAIFMNTPFDMKDMPSGSNLDDGVNDAFMALEIKEIFNKLNLLDDSATEAEDTKDKTIADMQEEPIDDLNPQLNKRIKWASKKVAEARRKQPCMRICLLEELGRLESSLEIMLTKREPELLSVNNGLNNAEETVARLKKVKEELKAEISGSKLIESEIREKCLEVSKKGGRSKNWEKQKVKMEEEMEMEKKKVSKWEQELVENEAAIIPAQVKLDEATNAKHRMNGQIYLENQVALEKWNCWKPKIEHAVEHTNEEEIDILEEQIDRLKILFTAAVSSVPYHFS